MSEMLLTKLHGARQKHVTVCFCTGLFAAAGAAVVGLGAAMLLDWWLDLALWIRAVLLLINLAVIIFVFLDLALWPIVWGPDAEGIALRVEDAEPSLATRLIASVQLSQAGAIPAGTSVSLVRAMIAQTEAMTRPMDFGRVVSTDRLIKIIIAAMLALLLGLAGFAWGYSNSVSTDLLKRAFLSQVPVPRKTHISMDADADKTIARGDPVTLAAKASGIVPDRGQVEISFAGGRQQHFPLERDAATASAARFACGLENVQDSFQYRVYLGDARSSWHRVRVLTRPLATQIEVQQKYPDYTRHAPENRKLGDLSILTGSRLLLRVTCNNDCSPTPANQSRRSWVHVVGSQFDAPMFVDRYDPHILRAEVPVTDQTTGMTIRLIDADGLASAADAATYRIDVVQDKDPVVRITYPVEREALATKVAKVVIGFDATDDFGIAKLSLVYKVDDGPVQTVALLISDPLHAHNRYAWDLGKVSPASTTQPSLEGSTVEYWLEAEDNNNVRASGPGRAKTEKYSLQVVSEEIKREEIARRMAAQIDVIKTGIDDQQSLSDTLGDFVLEKKTLP